MGQLSWYRRQEAEVYSFQVLLCLVVIAVFLVVCYDDNLTDSLNPPVLGPILSIALDDGPARSSTAPVEFPSFHIPLHEKPSLCGRAPPPA